MRDKKSFYASDYQESAFLVTGKKFEDSDQMKEIVLRWNWTFKADWNNETWLFLLTA